MWDSVTRLLLDFKWVILLAVAFGTVIAAAAARLSGNLSMNRQRWRFLGIFAGLRAREILWMAFLLARYAFIIAVVLFDIRLRPAQHGCYAAMCLGCILLVPRFKRAVLDVINSAVVYASLMVTNLMNGYMRDIRPDAYVLVITILLAVFLTVYATYFLLKDLADMLYDRKKSGVTK